MQLNARQIGRLRYNARMDLLAAAVDRFRSDLLALTRTEPERLGIAVSGGSDSLALLLLACSAWPGRVRAATVDHGLRPESASEAAHVAAICAALHVPHATLSVEVPARGEGIQGEARRARYAALAAWAEGEDVSFVLTAHHADDQAETLLMRLQRGAGIGGLAGVRTLRSLSSSVQLARPLLAWRRDELAEVVRASGVSPVEDPSNSDHRFDRVRMRARLGDLSVDPLALARSASALAEAEAALVWTADRLWEERSRLDGEAVLLDTGNLPPELVRRLVLRALAPGEPRGEEVQRLIRTLAEGGTATLAGKKCIGGERWRFSPAPPRRLARS